MREWAAIAAMIVAAAPAWAEAKACDLPSAVRAMREADTIAGACTAEIAVGAEGAACREFSRLRLDQWNDCAEAALAKARAAGPGGSGVEAEVAAVWIDLAQWRLDQDDRVLYARIRAAAE